MKNNHLKTRFYFIALHLVLISVFAAAILAQATAFTYQGKLTSNGMPATGSYEMRFTLYDIPGDLSLGHQKQFRTLSLPMGSSPW